MENDNNKESKLMATLTESIAQYAEQNMTDELKIRTDYQIAKLVAELKDTVEYHSSFVPTELYLKNSVFPPANLIH